MTTTLSEILKVIDSKILKQDDDGIHIFEVVGYKQAHSAIVKELEQMRQALSNTIDIAKHINYKRHDECTTPKYTDSFFKDMNEALTHLDKFLGRKI